MTTAFQTNAFQNNAFQIDAVEIIQATPGYFQPNYDAIRSLRFGREDEHKRPVGPLPEPQAPLPAKPDYEAQYSRKMAKLAAAIKRLNAEADATQARIDAIQAMELRRQEERRIAKELLLKRQEMALIAAQQAALIEEIEVLDIAFFAVVVMTIH